MWDSFNISVLYICTAVQIFTENIWKEESIFYCECHMMEMWNLLSETAILQMNYFKIPHSMTFYNQISTVLPSQIAVGYSLLLVGISAALKTCIHQEAWTQKSE